MADAEAPAHPRSGGWRLAGSTSAYLRSAAEQAIDWYPWGTEPFEVAARRRVPILLDIGASWCHWCHVMDEGTYSDPEVARLLRQGFVAIKVDRDEHPEVDRRYQRQVGALTGEGGWPLTAFLTPAGEVFLGGTYFPATDGHGRPGMRRLLPEVQRMWETEPAELARHARAIQEAVARHASRRSSLSGADEFLRSVRRNLHESFDPGNGGFGTAPKFPHPTALGFLLWDEFAHGIPESGERARQTLERMAAGGVYDHVGGGFHRYSVDDAWHIPHFEKMSSDNSALLAAYADGAARFGRAAFEGTVRGTLAWISTTLGSPGGGWGASQDADNAPGDDGGYYTWTRAQLHALLSPEEFRIFTRVYGVGSEGRMPEDPERSVLFRLMSAAEAAEGTTSLGHDPEATLARALAKVRAARAERPAPGVDPALYASLNGSMIRAHARAATVLGSAEPLLEARRAADRFLASGYRADRGVAHRLEDGRGIGYGLLEDQAEFALGLVELAGATGIVPYAERAEEILGLVDREFRGEDGLLRDLAPGLYDGAPLVGTSPASYPLEDSPHLAANAAAMLAAIRLASLRERPRWREFAEGLVAPIVRRIGDAGLFAAGTALAAGLLGTPSPMVVIEGNGPTADALERAARETYHPNHWVLSAEAAAAFSGDRPLPAPGRGRGARALVCLGTSCQPPIEEPEALRSAIRRAGRAAG